jgi:hypothetical protein|tara:strand:- start:550 stop:741 length:192 start_codon:yes stop_codon:yes gene_type:complete
MSFDKYQLKIISAALRVLIENYEDYDLESLMYSGTELEAEISFILGAIGQEHGISECIKENDA